MISDPVELSELISTTADLIQDDPTMISLVRVEWQRTPSGGMRRLDPPTTKPAKARYFGAVIGDPVYVTRDEGEHILARHVIVGMPGDDIQQKDTFTLGGREFEVVQMHPERSWQTKGWVVERSASPRGV